MEPTIHAEQAGAIVRERGAALAVALMSSVIGPVLVVWLTGKQRRVEKQQDYDRQDEVVAAAAAAATAAQTAAAANLVANQQTADSLEEIAERAARVREARYRVANLNGRLRDLLERLEV